MALKDNEKFNSLGHKVKDEYESIINDSKLDLEDKTKKIENLLKTDNTNENIVLEYLNLMNKLFAKSKDNDSIKKLLLQYECCIEEIKFNKTFQSMKVTKISYQRRIMDLISLIKEYKNKKILDDKIELLEKIKSQNVIKFHNTFPVNYNSNLELFFYTLYEALYDQIIKFFKNNIVKEQSFKDHIMQLTIERSQLMFSGEQKNSLKIKELEKKLDYIPFIYGTFNGFFSNFAGFIKSTNDKFCKRFEGDFFKDEKELLLFTDYIFFLSYYPFMTYDAKEYVNLWNDTFIDMKIEDKINLAKYFSVNNFTFKLNNNILEVEDNLYDESYSIPNIDDYSFITLIHYLPTISSKPDLIELNKFLKIDKYNEKIYIRTIWKSWEEFLIRVFSSNMIKSVFNKFFDDIKDLKNNNNKSNPQSFFDKNEIKLIINNIRYFIFKSDFHAMTIKKNLLIYMNGDPSPDKVNRNPLKNKLFFLSNNVKTNLHEIVGHLNIRFQYYLSKDKRYTSPKPNKPSSEAISREGKESGEFIEELIFGESEQNLTTTQILYILDIKNYEKDYIKFQEDFIKCGKMEAYYISEELKTFLKQLDIDPEEIKFKSKNQSCIIGMHKSESNFYRSREHPLDGYNDIYEQ